MNATDVARLQRFSAKAGEAPPAGDVRIRRAQSRDAECIMAATNAAFGLDRPAAYWRAKFRPADECFAFIAADEAGGIHAQVAGSPATIAQGGARADVLFAGDAFAARSKQAIRSQLFKRTASAFIETFWRDGRFDSILAFPNPVAILVLDTIVDNTVLLPNHFYHLVVGDGPQSGAAAPDVAVETYDELAEPVLAVAEAIEARRRQAKGAMPWAVARNRRWLAWRFGTVGAYYADYRFHLAAVDGVPFAWLATRVEGDRLLLVDWAVAGHGVQSRALLSQATRHILHRAGLRCARALMSPIARASWGSDAEWRPIGEPAIFLYVVRLRPSIVDYANMFITAGDTDLF